jgi:hypothetical protein
MPLDPDTIEQVTEQFLKTTGRTFPKDSPGKT